MAMTGFMVVKIRAKLPVRTVLPVHDRCKLVTDHQITRKP